MLYTGHALNRWYGRSSCPLVVSHSSSLLWKPTSQTFIWWHLFSFSEWWSVGYVMPVIVHKKNDIRHLWLGGSFSWSWDNCNEILAPCLPQSAMQQQITALLVAQTLNSMAFLDIGSLSCKLCWSYIMDILVFIWAVPQGGPNRRLLGF